MFKNIKARYLFIAAALFFLLGIGLIILIPFVSSNIDTKPLVIVLVILFIISTALVQAATYKAFSKKRKRKYITKKYQGNEDINELLINKGFKKDKESFGVSYYYKDMKKAFKVTVITNSKDFFKPEDTKANNNKKPVVDFSNCNKLSGIDIFLDVTDEVLDKAPDFTINTKTFSYIALVYKDNQFNLLNYEEIEDLEIKDMMQFLLDTMMLKEVIE